MWSDTCHIVDRIERKIYHLEARHNMPHVHALLEQFKDRLKCNLLGFYAYSGSSRDLQWILQPNMIIPGTNIRQSRTGYKPGTTDDFKEWKRKITAEFRGTGTVRVTGECTGYDEFYLLPCELQAKEMDASELVGATKAKMRKAFKDSLIGKRAGRLILDRLVNAIAAQI